jgi:cytochrome P450
MPEDEPFDLMEAFAYPLPVTVIAELIGVPAEDRADFKRWSGPVARTLEPTITQAEWEEAQEAERALDEYFERVIAERRDAPHEDLLSALILAEDAGEKLSHDELLVTLKLLLIAGNETTTNLIGNGMLALLRHPAQLDRLRDNPVLLESAIEELLRYDGPVQIDARWALQDVELRGKRILKGQGVIPLIGSANRDPRFFAEPRKLDIGREPNHHVAFGRGIHHCLGAPLARLEGQVAFQAFLEAFDRVALATDKPEFRDNVVLRGLRSLPLRVHRS